LKAQERETVDAEHSFLISKLKCKNCGCQFDVIERTELTYEIQKHDNNRKTLAVEVTHSEREEFEKGLRDLQDLLAKIFGLCSGDSELLTILHNELEDATRLTGNFSRYLKAKAVQKY
jgi:hypothetical protein